MNRIDLLFSGGTITGPFRPQPARSRLRRALAWLFAA